MLIHSNLGEIGFSIFNERVSVMKINNQICEIGSVSQLTLGAGGDSLEAWKPVQED